MATFDISLSTAKLRQQCFRNIHGGGRRVLDGGNMEVPAFLVVELISVYGLAPISRSRSHPTVKFRQRKEHRRGFGRVSHLFSNKRSKATNKKTKPLHNFEHKRLPSYLKILKIEVTV